MGAFFGRPIRGAIKAKAGSVVARAVESGLTHTGLGRVVVKVLVGRRAHRFQIDVVDEQDGYAGQRSESWTRLFGQDFVVDKWSLAR